MTTREEQLQYEIDSDAAAVAARIRSIEAMLTTAPAETPKGSAFIVRAAVKVAEHIKAEVEANTTGRASTGVKWLRNIDPMVAAVIAVRECIRLCFYSPDGKGFTVLQALATSVGQLYETEVLIANANAVNPVYMKRIFDQVKENRTKNIRHLRNVYATVHERITHGVLELQLSRNEHIFLGKVGINACLEAGVLDMLRTTSSRGMAVYYSLAPEVAEYISSYSLDDFKWLTDNSRGEMLVEPDPWFGLFGGGYLSPRRKQAYPLVKYKSRTRKAAVNWVRKNLNMGTCELEFNAANHLQSTSYQVHAPTLQAIEAIWNSGGGFLGVPSRNMPRKPIFPFADSWDKTDATPEELKAFGIWKSLARQHYDGLRSWRSRVLEVTGMVKSLNRHNGPIWFPVSMDSRSRKYYCGTPNPQGSDISKACLHMHTKLPLGKEGIYWLKVHIANSLGYDKTDFDDRVAYAEGLLDRLFGALDDVQGQGDIFGKDSPWCAYAACWELRAAMRSGDPESYETGIPVHMDATCSGLQHFSAIMRDDVGGLYVNLIDSPDGTKADIYSRVAGAAMDAMMADIRAGKVDPDIANFWLQYGVSRSLAKKPVMTYLYGAVQAAASTYIEDKIAEEGGWPDDFDRGPACTYMASKLFHGIEQAVPAACALMRWLRKLPHKVGNRPILWTTPSGFPVWHDYRQFELKRVEIRSCGMQKVSVRIYKDDIDVIRSRNAISPNFVHSLDACHVTLVADQFYKRGWDLVAIHDSLGTHPSRVGEMHKIIREQFVRMYEDGELLHRLVKQIGVELEPPALGELDLSKVKDSTFFFC